ncbi:MAG: hypothetical protein CVU36_13255 [Betaproteobacteria bacterium HGW-Betaproteobacteria-9]|jgi:hypothetical protein|nr:MAG: hypothetical protein CVU36_13255 [Betaproteobacteria bacterium HGW-Betaproteobacteria-9]
MGFLHRAALSLVLVPLLVMAGTALCLHFGRSLLDRAYLVEVLSMLGHARKEIVLERAQRPASSPPVLGDPVVLSTVDTASSRKHLSALSVRYAREGDRITAHFSAPGELGQQGLWLLEPVEPPGISTWVSNWRCISRSSGRWQDLAQTPCPHESTVTP